jgi:autotransporter adhesin
VQNKPLLFYHILLSLLQTGNKEFQILENNKSSKPKYMYTVKRVIISMFVSCLSFICACNKHDSNPGSDQLDPGRAAIKFNTSADFGSSTAFNVSNTSATQTSIQNLGSAAKTITLTASDVNGGSEREVTLMLLVPNNASTSNGGIVIDLALRTGAPQGNLHMVESMAGFGGPGYLSESGTVTITKLTATDIQGTFSAHVVDPNSLSLNVSNGSFSGKF